MADDVVGERRMSITYLRWISRSRKSATSQGAASDSNVQIRRKQSLTRRKSDRPRHSHSNLRMTKKVQRRRSSSQVKVQQMVTQGASTFLQNIFTAENIDEQSDAFASNTGIDDTFNNRLNSVQSIQSRQSAVHNDQQRHIRILRSLRSSHRVSPLNDSIDTHLNGNETGASTPADLFRAKKHGNDHTDVTINASTKQLKSTRALPKSISKTPMRLKRMHCGSFSCSPLYGIVSVLVAILLVTGLVAVFVLFLHPSEEKTTSTTVFSIAINFTTSNTTTSTLSTSATMTTSSTTTATLSITTTTTDIPSTTTTTTTTTKTTSTTTTTATYTTLTTTTTGATSTTTTTGTASTTTTTGTTSTKTTTSTRTTSTTSTTTPTIQSICNRTCLNQTWLSTASLFANWHFENNYFDDTNTYNGTPTNGPVFVQGYVGRAISFAASSGQMVSTSHIPLLNKTFSVDAWVYPVGLTNLFHSSICGICPLAANDYCLHMTFSRDPPSYTQYMGFYGDDVDSNSPAITVKNWIHVAFTFDSTTRKMSLYRNGVLLRSGTTMSQFKAKNGSFQIGSIPLLSGFSTTLQGYIDELSVSGRLKSSCEILELATLAAWFNFDNGTQPLLDLGPNSVSSTGSNYSFVSGPTLQAISFTGSSSSFFQASGFLALGIPSQPFSFSLWVQPQTLAGTLVQVSTDASGNGSCASFIGFASNGSLIAQVKTNTSNVAVSYPNLSLTSFSHIVQTWSSTNGLRLYVNSILVGTAVATTYWAASSWVNYVTLGGCLGGCNNCSATSGNKISPGPFAGAVDDFRVYSRELTANDVCTLFLYN